MKITGLDTSAEVLVQTRLPYLTTDLELFCIPRFLTFILKTLQSILYMFQVWC